MSTTSNKNLLIIIVVLVLTNIAVLGYFLWYKKPGRQGIHDDRSDGIAENLRKEVGFTDEQTASYMQLKERQREVIRPMFDAMRQSKDSLFRLLSLPGVPDSLVDKATDAIALKQKMLDMETFHHFRRVRALCKPDQEAKYDTLIARMFRKMAKPRNEQGKKEKKD